MDDYAMFLGIGIALLILFISCIFLFAVRDTNLTKRFKSSQKAEAAKFISQTTLEGKRLEVTSNERINDRNATSAEEIKKSEVLMHQATVSCKLREQDKKLEERTIIENSNVKQTEMNCQTAKDLTGVHYSFKMSQLQTNAAQFKSQLDYQTSALQSFHTLSTNQMQLDYMGKEITANAEKYIADKALEGQVAWNSAETARVDLQSQTLLTINREGLSVQKEKQELNFKLTQQKITSATNCFRDQMDTEKFRQSQKTKRAEIDAATKSLQAITNFGGAALGAASGNPLSILSGTASGNPFGTFPAAGPSGNPFGTFPGIPAGSLHSNSNTTSNGVSPQQLQSGPIIEEIS